VCGYNRKYAIAKLNSDLEDRPNDCKRLRRRGKTYGAKLIAILAVIWEATGYLCSVRLKAALPLRLPWIQEKFGIDERVEKQFLRISARQNGPKTRWQKEAGQEKALRRRGIIPMLVAAAAQVVQADSACSSLSHRACNCVTFVPMIPSAALAVGRFSERKMCLN
jgi:hypothetical protein